MNEAQSGHVRRGPGRPRNAQHDRSIVRAVKELLEEGGYAGLTIDSVAARAGVGRPTVYRRWPSKAALVMGALGESTVDEHAGVDTGNLRDDLLAIRKGQLRLLSSPEGQRVLPGLAADVMEQSDLHPDFSRRYVEPWRTLIAEAVDRAIRRGELPAGADARLVCDMLTGALVFRVLFARENLSEEALEAAIDLILAGLGQVYAVPGRG